MSAVEWIVGLLALVLAIAAGDLVSEEVRGWLDRVPAGMLKLAARRLPPQVRSVHMATWAGELHEILKGAEARPILRLWRGVGFAAGLLGTARSSAGIAYRRRVQLGAPEDELIDTLIAAALAVVCTFFTNVLTLMSLDLLAATGGVDAGPVSFVLAAVAGITSTVIYGWIFLRPTLAEQPVECE